MSNGKGMAPKAGYNHAAYRDRFPNMAVTTVTPSTRFCPRCKADWRGEPIKPSSRHYYTPGTTHFSRLIAQTDINLDRTVAWQCPDCSAVFPR